jgi:hypothetical protein
MRVYAVLVMAGLMTTCTATSQPASDTPTPSATIESFAPTQTPPQTYKPGEAAVIQVAGADYAKITIAKPSFVAAYKGQLSTDRPKTGDLFVQAWVTYEALATDGIDYNSLDWSTYADGANVTDPVFVFNAPKPHLKAGHLPTGRTVSFWIVSEVPAKGEVLLSYAPPQFGGNTIAEWKVR